MRTALVIGLVCTVALTLNKVIRMNISAKILNTEVMYAKRIAELVKSANSYHDISNMLLDMDKMATVTEFPDCEVISCDFSDEYNAIVSVDDYGYYVITLSNGDIHYEIKVVRLS